MFRFIILLTLSGTLLVSFHVIGHSGGLNAQGCHAGSRPYHCHRSPQEMVGNRLRCDLGSRSKDCIGGQASLSSSTKQPSTTTQSKPLPTPESSYNLDTNVSSVSISSDNIIKIQQRLQTDGLYDGAVDGVFGPATALALDVYKIKHDQPLGDPFNEGTLNLFGLTREQQ